MTGYTDSMRMKVGLTVTNDIDGEPMVAGVYGKEAIFDCYECDPQTFRRRSIRRFMSLLVKTLKMKRGPLYFWDDVGVPKRYRQTKIETTGTSAVQFILTSNITIHCLDKLARVYVNIFSCKDFEIGDARDVIYEIFDPKSIRTHIVYRR